MVALTRICTKCKSRFTPYGHYLRCPFCGWNSWTGRYEPETQIGYSDRSTSGDSMWLHKDSTTNERIK